MAKDFPRFPVTLETYREVLKDVLDLPALTEILRDIGTRKISLVEVETQSASPFASSLLFDYVATYMYEGDTPNAERRAAALALDRDLLRELLGQEELRELIDPAALDELEDSLQHRTEQARASDRDHLEQILRRIGDLTDEEVTQRVAEGYSAASMLAKLEGERRAVKVRIAGEERWIAAQDGGLYRDALGVPVPSGLPDAFLEQVPEPMAALMRRYARDPRPVPDRAARAAATASMSSRPCGSWSATAPWSAVSCCPAGPSASGATPMSCAACAAPASPCCARRSRPPTSASSPASCPPGRTSTPTGPRAPGPTGCARRSSRCRAWR